MVILLNTFIFQVQLFRLEIFHFFHFTSRFIGMVQCFALFKLYTTLRELGLVTPILVAIRVLGVETPKKLIAKGRKATRQNSFHLDT